MIALRKSLVLLVAVVVSAAPAIAQTCPTLLQNQQPQHQTITPADKGKVCSAINQVLPNPDPTALKELLQKDLLLVFLDPTSTDGNSLRDPMLFWSHRLWRGRPTRLQLIYPTTYVPTVGIQDLNYGPTSLPTPLGGGAGGVNSRYLRSVWLFTPTGDDSQISVSFAAQPPPGTSQNQLGGGVPSTSGLSPTQGPTGTLVAVRGANFGTTTGTVSFNGVNAVPTTWSDRLIQVNVPNAATNGTVSVTPSGGTPIAIGTFTVAAGSTAFTVQTISSLDGPTGTTITIGGNGFGAARGSVSINGIAARIVNWAATTIQVTIPNGASTGFISITAGGATVVGPSFDVSSSFAAAQTVPPYSFTTLVPVNVLVGLTTPRIAFSVGALWSRLHDQSVALTPNADQKTSTVTAGQPNGNTVKGVAMVHFNVFKYQNNLFGPAIGVLAENPVGYFVGGSYLFGKSDRFAFNFGKEYSKVNVLSGVSLGATVPNGTTVTQQVSMRSKWEIGVSYAFSVTGGSGGNPGGGGNGGNTDGNTGGTTSSGGKKSKGQ